MGDTLQSWSGGDTCLRRVLLDLMMSRNALPWPGADGVTVEEVLAAYVPASEQRRVPDQEELIRRHPELTPEIRTFFTLAGKQAGHCGRQGTG
jgi:hypothetical protein